MCLAHSARGLTNGAWQSLTAQSAKKFDRKAMLSLFALGLGLGVAQSLFRAALPMADNQRTQRGLGNGMAY